jgi:hypothetical protein
MTTATAKSLTWETNDGITFGYYDLGAAGDIEIEISERVVPSMWTVGTNVRYWSIVDENNQPIADGQEDGLRNAKRAALVALNDYLNKP